MIDEAKNEPEIGEDIAEEALSTIEETVEDTLAEPVSVPAEVEPVPAVLEEPVAKAKKKKEEEVVEEKTYTIPLGKALIMPPRKRAPRAMRMIRAYVVKHMKVPTRGEEEDEEPPSLTITQEVNERVWGRGIEKPPRKIRVRASKDSEGNVTVHLAEGE
jgi:large subunit ribosomal protein L31e